MFRRAFALCLINLALLCASADVVAQAASAASGEKVGWQTLRCTGVPLACEAIDGIGYLFKPAGATAVVLVSHGAQGLDPNIFHYVDALNELGIASLVMDHYTPRGIRRVADDLVAGHAKGANVLNMNMDSLTAADWLRRTQGFRRVGYLGESYGAGAGLSVNRKWTHDIVESKVRGTYRKLFNAKPMDVIVGLYPFCGVRDEVRDRYFDPPMLIVTGDQDDAAPAALCQRYAAWVNERGGKAESLVLAGQGHNFDFNHKRAFAQRHPNTANCDILVRRGGTVVDEKTGFTAGDIAAVLANCTTHGYHGGHTGNQFVAVPVWTAFLKKHLD